MGDVTDESDETVNLTLTSPTGGSLVPALVVALILSGPLAATPLAPAAQTFPGPPPVEQLARRADLVVLGEVRTAVGGWDAGRTNISTRVELAQAELLKGTEPSPVAFRLLGGHVGGEMSVVGGAVEFRPGERVLVFLDRRSDGSLWLTDLLHGKFSIERDAATGREHAVRPGAAGGAERLALDDVRALIRRPPAGQR